MAKKRNKVASLPVIEPNAAGIDVGATEIFVAVPADRDPESVRCFPTFTADLERLADWLQQCRIRTVAMESTGVYWIPLFQILEKRKLDVRQAERPTWKIASGFSIFIPLVCYEDPFVRMTKSVPSVPCGVIATTSSSWPPFTCSTCRRRWTK